MHIVLSSTIIFQTDVHQTASFTKKTNLPADTRYKVTYIHDINFSHICHFRPMTQPNPLKTKIFDPFPTQPAGQPNTWTTLVRRDRFLHCIYLTDTAMDDVNFVNRLTGVYNDFAGTEDIANDVHTQLAQKVLRHVLKQRHLHDHSTITIRTVNAGQ